MVFLYFNKCLEHFFCLSSVYHSIIHIIFPCRCKLQQMGQYSFFTHLSDFDNGVYEFNWFNIKQYSNKFMLYAFANYSFAYHKPLIGVNKFNDFFNEVWQRNWSEIAMVISLQKTISFSKTITVCSNQL